MAPKTRGGAQKGGGGKKKGSTTTVTAADVVDVDTCSPPEPPVVNTTTGASPNRGNRISRSMGSDAANEILRAAATASPIRQPRPSSSALTTNSNDNAEGKNAPTTMSAPPTTTTSAPPASAASAAPAAAARSIAFFDNFDSASFFSTAATGNNNHNKSGSPLKPSSQRVPSSAASGRMVKTPDAKVTDARKRLLEIFSAEPRLGDLAAVPPTSSSSASTIAPSSTTTHGAYASASERAAGVRVAEALPSLAHALYLFANVYWTQIGGAVEARRVVASGGPPLARIDTSPGRPFNTTTQPMASAANILGTPKKPTSTGSVAVTPSTPRSFAHYATSPYYQGGGSAAVSASATPRRSAPPTPMMTDHYHQSHTNHLVSPQRILSTTAGNTNSYNHGAAASPSSAALLRMRSVPIDAKLMAALMPRCSFTVTRDHVEHVAAAFSSRFETRYTCHPPRLYFKDFHKAVGGGGGGSVVPTVAALREELLANFTSMEGVAASVIEVQSAALAQSDQQQQQQQQMRRGEVGGGGGMLSLFPPSQNTSANTNGGIGSTTAAAICTRMDDETTVGGAAASASASASAARRRLCMQDDSDVAEGGGSGSGSVMIPLVGEAALRHAQSALARAQLTQSFTASYHHSQQRSATSTSSHPTTTTAAVTAVLLRSVSSTLDRLSVNNPQTSENTSTEAQRALCNAGVVSGEKRPREEKVEEPLATSTTFPVIATSQPSPATTTNNTTTATTTTTTTTTKIPKSLRGVLSDRKIEEVRAAAAVDLQFREQQLSERLHQRIQLERLLSLYDLVVAQFSAARPYVHAARLVRTVAECTSNGSLGSALSANSATNDSSGGSNATVTDNSKKNGNNITVVSPMSAAPPPQQHNPATGGPSDPHRARAEAVARSQIALLLRLQGSGLALVADPTAAALSRLLPSTASTNATSSTNATTATTTEAAGQKRARDDGDNDVDGSKGTSDGFDSKGVDDVSLESSLVLFKQGEADRRRLAEAIAAHA